MRPKSRVCVMRDRRAYLAREAVHRAGYNKASAPDATQPDLWLNAGARVRGDLVRVHAVLGEGLRSLEHTAFTSRNAAAMAKQAKPRDSRSRHQPPVSSVSEIELHAQSPTV